MIQEKDCSGPYEKAGYLQTSDINILRKSLVEEKLREKKCAQTNNKAYISHAMKLFKRNTSSIF